MNNPYLLKKQLKDNEEELSNYLRDMNIWQEQMKRKEHSLPLKSPEENKKPKIRHMKNDVKKISSWDYAAWDKFDVDKICEEMDIQNESNINVDDNSINECSNYELQSNQSEGLYEKNLGNALVQKQKWAEAILRYTRAIEYYNKDPVFFANRALCYLKTNEFKLAISDCTSSLKLDITYVKAYQRRSAAYTAINMYDKAIEDLNEILKLEPNNKQAKMDLEVANNKIKQVPVQKISDITVEKINSLNNLQCKNIDSNILCKDVEEPVKTLIPKWPLRVDCKQISCRQKPPHLRSKKPLFSPIIKDAQLDQKLNTKHLLHTTLKEVCEEKKDQSKTKEVIKKDSVQTDRKQRLMVPPPPCTYIQLKKDWAYLQTDSQLLFEYLKQIPGKRLPTIVCSSMENSLFVDILRILRFEFLQNGHEITDYLIGISKLPRLQMLVMFCSDDEVSCIKDLLNHVSKFVSENVLKNLKISFGV